MLKLLRKSFGDEVKSQNMYASATKMIESNEELSTPTDEQNLNQSSE